MQSTRTEMTAPDSDETLTEVYVRTACRDSLNELLARHLGGIHQLMFSMVLDDNVADDLTQEVFLRVVRSLPSFRGNSRFRTWLHRIALNVAYSHLQGRQGGAASCGAAAAEPVSPAPDPQRSACGKELGDAMETALARLSPKLRAAIVLTCLRHHTPEEVAEIEGCSIGTMYWRVHQARRLLKSSLRSHLS